MANAKVKEWDFTLAQEVPEDLLSPDLADFLSAFDPELEGLFNDIKNFVRIFNPAEIDARFLDVFLMSRGFKTAIDFKGIQLTETEKRKLALLAVQLYRQKGTGVGIVNAVRLLLGLETRIINSYNIDVWVLGESDLGIDTVLFLGDDLGAGHPILYSFDIEILEPSTAEQRDKVRAIVRYMKPLHTHLLKIIEPPLPPDHWELGISELGITTDLH